MLFSTLIGSYIRDDLSCPLLEVLGRGAFEQGGGYNCWETAGESGELEFGYATPILGPVNLALPISSCPQVHREAEAILARGICRAFLRSDKAALLELC